MTKELSFPWDMLDAETLRNIGRQIGLGGSRSRDELLEFLQDVERQELQRALKTVEAKDRKKLEAKREAEAPRKRAREPESELHNQNPPGPSQTRSGKPLESALLHPRRRMVVQLPRWPSDMKRRKILAAKESLNALKNHNAAKEKGKQKEGEDKTEEDEEVTDNFVVSVADPTPKTAALDMDSELSWLEHDSKRTRSLDEAKKEIKAPPRKRPGELEPEMTLQGIPGPFQTRRGKAPENASSHPAKRRARGMQVEVVLPRWSDLRRRRESTSSREAPKDPSKGKGRRKVDEEKTDEDEDEDADEGLSWLQEDSKFSPQEESDSDVENPDLDADEPWLVVTPGEENTFVSCIKSWNVSIRTAEDQNIGQMEVLTIDRAQAVKECGSLYKALRRGTDLRCFAEEVFTEEVYPNLENDGYLQEVINLLTPCWATDEFAKESTLVYVKEFSGDAKWDRKDVGAWAYRRLLSLPICKNANYLFTRPADSTTETLADARMVHFLRKVGFRRIGTSAYFAWAKDPAHPSRAVPLTEDAAYEEPESDRWWEELGLDYDSDPLEYLEW